jgi:hypothetical protein
MDKPAQRFSVNTRVRLKDGVDPGFYEGFTRVGQEGWVRKRRLERYGYPQIYVEWDKDAWSFNGQPDGWGWEGQFEAVEGYEMAEPDDNIQPEEQPDFESVVRGATETFIENLMDATRQANEHQQALPNQQESDDDETDWETLAAQASEAIVKSPAYIVIALEHLTAEGAPPMVIPRIFHASRKPEFALIAQSQLAHVLASMQDETIATLIQKREFDDEK